MATHTSIASIDGTPQPLDDLSVNDLSVALSPDGRSARGRAVSAMSYASGTSAPASSSASSTRGATETFTLEFSPDGPDPRHFRLRARRISYCGRRHRSADRPASSRPGDRRTMIDLSPDGRRLLETHGDGHGAVSDVDPASWARRACTLANRTLTREERNEFVSRPALRAGLRGSSPSSTPHRPGEARERRRRREHRARPGARPARPASLLRTTTRRAGRGSCGSQQRSCPTARLVPTAARCRHRTHCSGRLGARRANQPAAPFSVEQ